MNIYVGNLAYTVTEEQLKNLFATYGTVTAAKVVMDKLTGNSKGFGFIEMATEAEAENAINGLNNQEINGRRIRVSKANPPKDRADRPSRDSRPPRRFNSYR